MLTLAGSMRTTLAAFLLIPASLSAQAAEVESTYHQLNIDSGLVSNNLPGPSAVGIPQVVWSTVVSIDRASWLRLSYQSVMLSGSPNPGSDGSFLRLTSMRDGAVMTQHMRHVNEWQNTSAYFNGNTVLVELLAQPGTGANRIIIKGAAAGPFDQAEPDSICGSVDDRTLSSDNRVARVMPVGCTAWMINDCNHCFLSAGHCGISGSQVIQFNVPLSNASGTPQAPPPSDQYAIDPASIQEQSGGASLGDDWAYFGCFANSTTGLTPYDAQGSVAFDLVNPPSVASPAQTIRITGCGSTSSPVSPTWYLVQKTHTGPYFNVSGDVIQYTVDTTGGNSGSPVILEGTNNAIGIHTNAGCNSVGGNQGCGLTNADLQAALANPLGICAGPCGGGGSPLTTTFANNNGGSAGGAVYFSLSGVAGGGGATITDIDLNCAGAGGATGSIEIYLQDGCTFDHLGVWGGPVATSASTTTNASGTPTNFVLNTPLSIGEGCCVGVAIVANGFGHAYTTGTSPFQLTYATSHLELVAGSASNAPFAGSAFNPRVVNANFNYTVGGACFDLASAESYGDGCVASYTSFYEELTTAGFDLANTDFNGTFSPSGYTVTSTPGSGVIAPGAIGATTVLTMPDDGQVAAGTLGLVVGSNGWVALAGGNSNAFVPNSTTMLNNPATGLYAWTDLQPNNSGTVTYEEDPATGRTRTTFEAVHGWNTTDDHWIQFDFNVITGNWNLRIGAVGFNNPEDWVVGYSPGGTSADPGSRDLTLASLFAFNTQLSDVAPLTLEAVGTPQVGQPFMLTTSNIEPTAIFHVGIVGLTQVTVPLQFVFPGANPGCSLNASLDLVMGPDVIFGGPGSFTWEGIDLTPTSLLGFELHFTSATLDLTVLSDTTRTANGIRAVTGF